jgi:hypothetical protein
MCYLGYEIWDEEGEKKGAGFTKGHEDKSI